MECTAANTRYGISNGDRSGRRASVERGTSNARHRVSDRDRSSRRTSVERGATNRTRNVYVQFGQTRTILKRVASQRSHAFGNVQHAVHLAVEALQGRAIVEGIVSNSRNTIGQGDHFDQVTVLECVGLDRRILSNGNPSKCSWNTIAIIGIAVRLCRIALAGGGFDSGIDTCRSVTENVSKCGNFIRRIICADKGQGHFLK